MVTQFWTREVCVTKVQLVSKNHMDGTIGGGAAAVAQLS